MTTEKVIELLVRVSSTILDCIENCIDTMTIASGKNIKYVWYCTIGYLGISIVFGLLGIPLFISWQESLTACIIMGAITLMNYISKESIQKIQDSLQKPVERFRSKEEKEDGQHKNRGHRLTDECETDAKGRPERPGECN